MIEASSCSGISDSDGKDLNEENVYVQELKKVFDGCDAFGEGKLDKHGIRELCARLHLTPHFEFILDRLLTVDASGTREKVVAFPAFKKRFVRLLPDVISIEENQNRNSAPPSQICTEISDLEDKIVEPESRSFSNMSSYDKRKPGRIVQPKLNDHSNMRRIPDENNSNQSFKRRVSSTTAHALSSADIQLFGALPQKQGRASTQTLIEHIEKLGVKDARQYLSQLDLFDLNDEQQDCLLLSRALILELTEAATSGQSPFAVIAFLLWQHEMDRLKVSESEARAAAEHYRREMFNTQERHQALIEEIDQNANQFERSNSERIKQIQTRHQQELKELTADNNVERQHLLDRAHELNEQLKLKSKAEQDCRQKFQQINKEYNKINDELLETQQSLKEVEDLNRDLRNELQKATALAKRTALQQAQHAVVASSGNTFGAIQPRSTQEQLLQHKLDMAQAQNRRLKDKIDEISMSNSKPSTSVQHSAPTEVCAFKFRQSAEFKRRVLNLCNQRKRAKRNEESISELDSDFEISYYRPRRRRKLKRRDRQKRSLARIKRQAVELTSQTSTESDINNRVSGQNSSNRRQLDGIERRVFLEDRKQWLQRSKNELAEQAKRFEAERSELCATQERERVALREQCVHQIANITEAAHIEKERALSSQMQKLTEKFEREKSRLVSEHDQEVAALEKSFAESKMQIMARLQADFDTELRRAKMPSPGQLSSSDEHKVKVLEESIEGQRKGFEQKIAILNQEHLNAINELTKQIDQYQTATSLDEVPEPLKTQIDKWIDEIRSEYDQEIKSLVEKNHHSINQLCEQYESEKASLEQKYADEIETVENEKVQLHKEFNELQQSLAVTETDKESLSKQVIQLTNQIDTLITKRSEAIDCQCQTEMMGIDAAVLTEEIDMSDQTVQCQSDTPRPHMSHQNQQTEWASFSDQYCQTEQDSMVKSSCAEDIHEERSPKLAQDSNKNRMFAENSVLVIETHCMRCRVIINNLAKIDHLLATALEYHLTGNDRILPPIGESGVEDVGSSAESVNDDAVNLNRQDVQKQRQKVRLARQYLAEMLAALTIEESQLQRRDISPSVESPSPTIVDTGVDSNLHSPTPIRSDSVIKQQATSDKLFLEERLKETRSLVNEAVESHRLQSLEHSNKLQSILEQMTQLLTGNNEVS